MMMTNMNSEPIPSPFGFEFGGVPDAPLAKKLEKLFEEAGYDDWAVVLIKYSGTDDHQVAYGSGYSNVSSSALVGGMRRMTSGMEQDIEDYDEDEDEDEDETEE